MSAEHFFGVSRERLSPREARRQDKIARQFGAHLVEVMYLPGVGYQRWFAGPNRGEPFNSRLARRVADAIGARAESEVTT